MPERVYCCEQSAAEPLIGTADQVDVWVLLEYRPAWKARAVEDNSLGGEVRHWLEANLAALADSGLKARPQLVRRPEIDGDEVHLLVGLPNALVCISGVGYGFLADVRLTDVVAGPRSYPLAAHPQYFVCTNGQRDLCCARFGLPVYAALRELLGARVWQTTHLGGHRFAPNVLALPQGALYGRVREADIGALVDRVEAGELSFPHLRGRTWLPPAAQAAEAATARSDLLLEAVEEQDGDTLVRFAAAAGSAANGSTTVRVRRASEPVKVLKSCGDPAASQVWPLLAD